MPRKLLVAPVRNALLLRFRNFYMCQGARGAKTENEAERNIKKHQARVCALYSYTTRTVSGNQIDKPIDKFV